MQARHDRRVFAAALGLALVPFVASAISLMAAGHRLKPTADLAAIELQVRDVGQHPVLLGPASRFGWSHPGPAMYYALAPVYRLFGATSWALALSTLCLNAAAIVGMAVVARRRGGAWLSVWVLLGALLLLRALGANALRDPWNPHIIVLPLALLILLCWDLTAGDVWAGPWAAAVGTFVVQTHVGAAPVAGAVLIVGWGAVAVRWLRRRGRGDGKERRTAKAAAVTLTVLVVLWAPALVQQVRPQERGGNLAAIMSFFLESEVPRPGFQGRDGSLDEAVELVGLELAPRAQWLVGHVPRNPYSGEVDLRRAASSPLLRFPVVILILTIAGLLAVRRRPAPVAWNLVLVVVVALAASVLGVSRVVNGVFFYVVRWVQPVGMVAWIAAGWVLYLALGVSHRPAVRRGLLVVLGGALVATAAIGTGAAVRADSRELPAETPSHFSVEIATLSPAVRAAIGPTREPLLVRPEGGFTAQLYEPGLVLELEHRGYEVILPSTRADVYGDHRVERGRRAHRQLIVADRPGTASARSQPGAVEVAHAGEITVFLAPR